MKQLATIVLLLIASQHLFAQSTHVLPGDKSKYIYDRWQILYGNDNRSSSLGNSFREAMYQKALEVSDFDNSADVHYVLDDNSEFYDLNKPKTKEVKVVTKDGFTTIVSKESKSVESNDNTRKPFLGFLYESEPFIFQVNNDNFKFRVRPLLSLQYGRESGNDNSIFQNTRGLEIRGVLDEKLYFYSNILENQAGLPTYFLDRVKKYKTIPGNGFYKGYKDKMIIDMVGYDYLNAQAYLGYNMTKSVALELGHGRHFIGDGLRSLFLSDYSHNYFYLKLNANFWKFNYQTIYAELAPIASQQNPNDTVLPKKYTTTHYLTFMPNKNLEFGLFETIVFSRENHFEFQYLNPVILYRTVEQFLDSPDNVLIGLSARWTLANRFKLYGQLILDEFVASQITSSDNWWANKYGYQLGVKYVNAFGVNNLDLQYEYNKVRPYTYSHRDALEDFPTQSVSSYTHHNQPLAHPLGANFTEHVFEVNYRPMNKLWVSSRAYYSIAGLDKGDGVSYGNDILLITGLRQGDYGNEMYQGLKSTILGLDTRVSYEIIHGLSVNLNYIRRQQKLEEVTNVMNYIGGGINYNLASGIRNY